MALTRGVAGVGGAEAYLATDVGDTDAVAIAGDAGDDALEQEAVAGVVEIAEAQGV